MDNNKPTNLFYTQQFLTIMGIFYVTSLSPAIDKWIDGRLDAKEARQLANAAVVSLVGGFLKLGDPSVYTTKGLPGRSKAKAIDNVVYDIIAPVETAKIQNTLKHISTAVESLNPLTVVAPSPLQIKALTATVYKNSTKDSSDPSVISRAIEKNAVECIKLYSPVTNNHVEFTDLNDNVLYAFAPHVSLVVEGVETPFHVAVINTKYPTQSQLSEIYGNTVTDIMYADFVACCTRFGIVDYNDVCHFIGQTGHESGGLKWLKELATGDDYEWREDLGNNQAGDGRRFKGVSPLQMTGRFGYQAFANYMSDQDIMQGCDYVASKYVFLPSGFWWLNNKMSQFIANGATIQQVSTRVNGGNPANGLSDRIYYYNRAKSIFKVI